MRLSIDLNLEHKIDRFITHYAQNWMSDYDPDEIGQYLVEECRTSYTGDYQLTVEIRAGDTFRYPATRHSFLIWRYKKKTAPLPNTESKAQV